MISDQVGLILGVFSALLMIGGIAGVFLAARFSKPSPSPVVAPAPIRVREDIAALPDEQILPGRKAAFRRGLYVLVALAILTAIEFIIAAVLEGSAVLLFVVALAKAGLILQYFMHVDQVWSEGETH